MENPSADAAIKSLPMAVALHDAVQAGSSNNSGQKHQPHDVGDGDTADKDVPAPLALAARNGHIEMVQLLLENGESINSSDNEGRTALSWAAEKGHREVVRLLCQGGANRDPKDSHGRTPLVLAARNGHDEVVRLLLEQGANKDSRDDDGLSPLSWAAQNGHYKAAELLVEKRITTTMATTDDSEPTPKKKLDGEPNLVPGEGSQPSPPSSTRRQDHPEDAIESVGTGLLKTSDKRLIICCDGGRDDRNSSNGPTRAATLARCIRPVDPRTGSAQIVYYSSGRGSGHSFAAREGISAEICTTYSFICHNFSKDDQIILVGYSKGAFIVRRLATFIHDVGLLTKSEFTELRGIYGIWEKFAEGDTSQQTLQETLDPLHQKGLLRRNIAIKACAVWDTTSPGLLLPDNLADMAAYVSSSQELPENVEKPLLALVTDEADISLAWIVSQLHDYANFDQDTVALLKGESTSKQTLLRPSVATKAGRSSWLGLRACFLSCFKESNPSA